MSKKSSKKLLRILSKTLDRYETLPPVIENFLYHLENQIEEGNLLQVLDRYVKYNTPSVPEAIDEKGGDFEVEEEVREKIQEYDMQALNRFENLQRRLCRVFQDQLVVVEFDCGKFCKKAEGCLNLIGSDFVEVVRTTQSPVIIKLFSKLGVIDIEEADRIIIPIDRVAGIELNAVCPPCPKPPCPRPKPWPHSQEEDVEENEEE